MLAHYSEDLCRRAYATREDAIKAICGKLTRFRRMSGIYAGLLVADYNKKMHNVENIGTCGH